MIQSLFQQFNLYDCFRHPVAAGHLVYEKSHQVVAVHERKFTNFEKRIEASVWN